MSPLSAVRPVDESNFDVWQNASAEAGQANSRNRVLGDTLGIRRSYARCGSEPGASCRADLRTCEM